MAWVETTDPTFNIGPYNDAILMFEHVGWGLEYGNGSLRLNHNSAAGFPQYAFEPAAIVDGAWHHVAATFGDGWARLYVDSKLLDEEVGDSVGVFAGAGQLATFGAFRTLGTTFGYLLGAIDEIKVFDVVLDEAEIACAAE